MKINRIAALAAVGCLTVPLAPVVAHASPAQAPEPYKFSCEQVTRVAAVLENNRVIDYDFTGFGTAAPKQQGAYEPPRFPTDGSPVIRTGGRGTRYVWKDKADGVSRGAIRMQFRDDTLEWKISKPNLGWGYTENVDTDEFGNMFGFVEDGKILRWSPKWNTEGMTTAREVVVPASEIRGWVEQLFTSGSNVYFKTRPSLDPAVQGEGKLYRLPYDPISHRRLGDIQRVDVPGVDLRRTVVSPGAGADTFFGMRDEKATVFHYNPETQKIDLAAPFGDRWPGVKWLGGYRGLCTDNLPRVAPFPEDSDTSTPGMTAYGNAREAGAEVAYNSYDSVTFWGANPQTEQADWEHKMQWTALTDAPGYPVGTPALVHTPKGGKNLWRRNSNGLYMRTRLNEGACNPSQPHTCTLEAGGVFKSDPTVVPWGADSEIAFGVDADGMIWRSTSQDLGTPTGSWQTLHKGELIKNLRVKEGTSPVAVWQRDELNLFVISTAGLKVITIDPENGTPTTVRDLPAFPADADVQGAPQVATYAINARIVVTDKNHRVFTSNRRLGAWQPWTEVKFKYQVSGKATLAYTGDGRTFVFANGAEAEGVAPSRIQAVEVGSNGSPAGPQIDIEVPNLRYDPAPLNFRTATGLNAGVALMTDQKLMYFALPAVPVSPNRTVAEAPQLELKGEAALPRPNKKQK